MLSRPGHQTALAQTKARYECGLIQVSDVDLNMDHYLKFCGVTEQPLHRHGWLLLYVSEIKIGPQVQLDGVQNRSIWW